MGYLKALSAAVVLLLLAACSSLWNFSGETRTGVSSSLVDYLYPDGEVPPGAAESIPHLELPLSVGIAFVPSPAYASPISEASKIELLEQVRAKFVDRDFISRIEVIPETYLRSSKGVNGMQQVARIYSVDAMALVSYDQVAVSEDNPSSFLYWTIVGSYIIKATSNEVQTFVDTAVFDVKTARLLFRAPGVDRMSERSTLVEAGEAVRKTREASFAAAMDQMTANLDDELGRFTERVKQDPKVAQVEWKPGSGGGGLGILTLLLLGIGARRRTAVASGERLNYSRLVGDTGADRSSVKRFHRVASSAPSRST